MKGIWRLLSGLLAAIMVIAMLPVQVLAEEETTQETAAVTEPLEPQDEIQSKPVQGVQITEEHLHEESMLAGPAANLPASLYLTQERSGTCTLCSAAMMLRSRMYLSGSSEWSSVTESGIKSAAWSDGLKWNWTYKINGSSLSVSHVGNLGGISIASLKSLLDKHPEGIVLYVRDLPHAVFVTDYEGDTFYCAETVSGYSGKRIPLASSWIGTKLGNQARILSCADDYWYVSSYSIAVRPAEYTISYDANGGRDAPGSHKKTQNKDATLSSGIPTRENYLFLGWALDAAADTADYLPGAVYSENKDVTLYAVWEHVCAGGHTYGNWEITKAATAAAEGEELRICGACDAVQTRKLMPVALAADVEPGKVTAGAIPGDVKIGLSARMSIGGAPVTDLELEYVIIDETGKEYSLEEALAAPGKYTITPKVKIP